MFSQIGIPGLLLLLFVCLVIFGSKNLPSIGRSIGTSVREFKDALMGKGNEKQHESLMKEKQASESGNQPG